jgi:hypothetical protein
MSYYVRTSNKWQLLRYSVERELVKVPIPGVEKDIIDDAFTLPGILQGFSHCDRGCSAHGCRQSIPYEPEPECNSGFDFDAEKFNRLVESPPRLQYVPAAKTAVPTGQNRFQGQDEEYDCSRLDCTTYFSCKPHLVAAQTTHKHRVATVSTTHSAAKMTQQRWNARYVCAACCSFINNTNQTTSNQQ